MTPQVQRAQALRKYIADQNAATPKNHGQFLAQRARIAEAKRQLAQTEAQIKVAGAEEEAKKVESLERSRLTFKKNLDGRVNEAYPDREGYLSRMQAMIDGAEDSDQIDALNERIDDDMNQFRADKRLALANIKEGRIAEDSAARLKLAQDAYDLALQKFDQSKGKDERQAADAQKRLRIAEENLQLAKDREARLAAGTGKGGPTKEQIRDEINQIRLDPSGPRMQAAFQMREPLYRTEYLKQIAKSQKQAQDEWDAAQAGVPKMDREPLPEDRKQIAIQNAEAIARTNVTAYLRQELGIELLTEQALFDEDAEYKAWLKTQVKDPASVDSMTPEQVEAARNKMPKGS